MAIRPTSAASNVSVTVLAFARLRELLQFSRRTFELAEPADAGALWRALIAATPEIAALRPATRLARNGTIVGDDAALAHGDEIALLPPVSGG